MIEVLIVGMTLGMALTVLVQEALRRIDRCKDRKQAEFEAAVEAAAARKTRSQAQTPEDRYWADLRRESDPFNSL